MSGDTHYHYIRWNVEIMTRFVIRRLQVHDHIP
jgi:hypothetical protein